MGFLDNLENSLKNLETQEETVENAERLQARRETERARARAAAPWAARLKNAPYTAELLRQVTRIGFSQRTKVNMTWLDGTLRLDARDKRLELRPTRFLHIYLDAGIHTVPFVTAGVSLYLW
jgi:hypothetical protein